MSDLVEVSFQPAGKVAWIQAGATVLAASEAAGVEIVVGCTSGVCGTDPVYVLEGLAGLAPAGDTERATLDRMGLAPEYRLACSASVENGPIVIELGRF